MYISRVALNLARSGGLRLAGSPYLLHAAVEKAFPPNVMRRGDEGRILWRLDVSSRKDGGVWLYVVSPSVPDLSHIAEQAGWAQDRGETKEYTSVLDALEEGQAWQFRLKANPARKVYRDWHGNDGESVVGSIQGHVTEAQQLEWLLARSARCGFDIPESGGLRSVAISHRKREYFRHGADGNPVTLSTAQFDGRLVVVDADAFRRTLCCGLGRAKGFGCGLMTIAPIKNID